MKRAVGSGPEVDASSKRQAVARLLVPSDKIGWIIGKGGETIREIQSRTGSRVVLPRGNNNRAAPPVPVEVTIEGGNADDAIVLIKRIIQGRRLLPPFHGSECPQGVSKLYIDILNFVDSHFFQDLDDWSIAPVLARAHELVEACKLRNIALVVFIDSIRTEEALDKWRDRMTRAVTLGTRNVPQNISGIMAELFHLCGAEVRLSTEVNNDDTLASYAFHDGVPLVSGDKDFLRYTKEDGSWANLEIYSDFRVVSDGVLNIQVRPHTNLEGKRPIISPPPKFQLFGTDEDAWVHNLSRKRLFRGGAPSPLVKQLAFNPYLRIRPLRIALYKDLLANCDLIDPIKEEFPIWADLQVLFIEDLVDISGPQDSEMLALLRQPRQAFGKFFPRELDPQPPSGIDAGNWYRHCHGCKVIVIELCCYLRENKTQGMTFLNVLIESDKWS